MQAITLFWFRRDLRLNDNAALYAALTSGDAVLPVFIFDQHILSRLEAKDDARVSFIYQRIEALKQALVDMGSDLIVLDGDPAELIPEWVEKMGCKQVFANEDYEPDAIKRDYQVLKKLKDFGCRLNLYKDQVIFSKNEVVKDDGAPYTVFTPYSKRWKAKLEQEGIPEFRSEDHVDRFHKTIASDMPSLEQIGFQKSKISYVEPSVSQGLIRRYHETRDIPSIQGTSRLSVSFRFGTISIRDKVKKALLLNEKWLNELIWREFYMQILWHFPRVVHESFKPSFDRIKWENNAEWFEKWKFGLTGYPLVDAGMRELLHTGWMHNRVRMVVASFLSKHLLSDWRLGEQWFAARLLDYELASNNGGWQWAAGCGVDAAPYFRVFNPTLQQKKFDPENSYIRKWVPEFGHSSYPKPMVIHEVAREKCLTAYRVALAR